MGFSQALSGLNAQATNLDVIGNNIANSQTVGYKGGKAIFADVFAGAKTGLGTRVSSVMQDFSNGTLENTGRNMDLAIDGGGFFRLSQDEQIVFSRNGQFNINSEGHIVNAQGARLTGYPAGTGTGADPVALEVPNTALQAQASTGIDAAFNLDAGVPAVAIGFDPTNPDSYSYANNVTLYDSQGNAHNTTLYFSKIADNDWEVRMSPDGVAIEGPATLEFDENGIIDGGNVDTTIFNFTPPGGVAAMAITLDLAGTTQFADSFDMKEASQDGYSSGALVGVQIDDAGNVIGNYANEESRNLGTIALVNFTNAEGLTPIGDNAWAVSTASGQPLLGVAGVGQFGSIQSGVVENSNVDLTRQLVDMIIAQRNYQANSQTIKVQDEVLQSAVNLR